MSDAASYFSRHIMTRISEAMLDTPVILISGPRQAGKTTLVRKIAGQSMRYLTMDDGLTLLAAKADPVGLIRTLDRAVIDEIQRAPELLLAIKKTVDEDRRPGRFLLTGSANLMALPTVADSLAGRMETLMLLPLSQSERQGSRINWLDMAFAGKLPQLSKTLLGADLVEAVLQGGYPEAISRTTTRRRTTWSRQYLDAIIERDIREVAGIDRIDQLARFLRALAQVSGQLCNYSQLGGQVGLDHKTATRYVSVFEQMYLLKRIAPWAGNRLSRVVKTPKLQFIDSGLLATLVDLTAATIERDRSRFGNVLETFVFSELAKQATFAEDDYQLLYYRDHDQYDVDLVIENAAGDIIGVEIKAAASVRESDLRGLKRLAKVAGAKFKMGVILYDGTQTLPLGHDCWAAPISGLWGKLTDFETLNFLSQDSNPPTKSPTAAKPGWYPWA